jgi:hypothetical protein
MGGSGNWDESARVGTTACVRPRARGRRASREQGGLTGHGCPDRINQTRRPASGCAGRWRRANLESPTASKRAARGRTAAWLVAWCDAARQPSHTDGTWSPTAPSRQPTHAHMAALACSSQVRTARAECFAETTTRQRPQTTRTRTHDGKSSSSRPCRRRRLRAFPVMAA